MMVSLIASIPSPPENQISIGPLDLRAYGFLIALGVLAGVWVSSRRLAQDGLDPEIMPNMALWVLPAAIVGARAYFVLTNWGRFSDDLASAFMVWEGGLGIPGGVALGAAVGVWWLRRQQVPLAPVFTASALGLPLGQIIGRWGNWFNQELYGRPTDLPWGLEIDEAHRLAGYENNELFHPTFAYEIIWNVALLFLLFRLDRKRILRPGALFAVYLIGYGIGRILIETVRIDPVNEFLGIRLHIWAMVVFIAAAAYYLRRFGFAGDDDVVEEPEPADLKPQAPLAKPKKSKSGGSTKTKERATVTGSGLKADAKSKVSGAKDDAKSKVSGAKADAKRKASEPKADGKSKVSGATADAKRKASDAKADTESKGKSRLAEAKAKIEAKTKQEDDD